MATENPLLVELREGVLYLTLNRPDRLNAMSEQMLAGLFEQLRRAETDNAVGAVVLTGAGRGFCAGGDVRRMRERDEASQNAPAEDHSGGIEARVSGLVHSGQISLMLHEIPKVTIAAVNGPAAGAGLSIALACDIRIASDAARFGTAFARVGFSGDFDGSYFLTQLVGPSKARELYFSAEVLGADEALKIGMVNRVAPAASFMEEVHAYAKRIAEGPRIAYSYIKANINLAMRADARAVLEREAFGQALTGLTEDHREAVKAFLEKRQPKFHGR